MHERSNTFRSRKAVCHCMCRVSIPTLHAALVSFVLVEYTVVHAAAANRASEEQEGAVYFLARIPFGVETPEGPPPPPPPLPVPLPWKKGTDLLLF